MERGNKANIIGQIYERSDSDLVKLFIALLDSLVEENRQKNDTARPEEILMNQGAIKQLRYLQDTFTKHPVISKKQ